MKLGMTYLTEHLPEHIDADMRAMADMGCTEVLVAFLEPNLTGGVDGGFRRAAQIGRSHGLTVYATIWGMANTFGGGKVSKFMLEDPSIWRMRADGKRFAKACLNHPALLERYGHLAKLCHERGYQGVRLDSPGRMREDTGEREKCFCQYCRAKFHDRYGRDLVTDQHSRDFETFAEDSLVEFVAGFCAQIKGIDPELKTIVCLWPRERNCWDRVCAIKPLDAFGTYPYWPFPYSGYSTVEEAVAGARTLRYLASGHGKESWTSLCAYGIPSGREEEILYRGGKELVSAGCDALYVWTYRAGLATFEECADTATAWTQVLRLYQDLRQVPDHFGSDTGARGRVEAAPGSLVGRL